MTATITSPGPELSASFTGETIRPEDPQYDIARSIYNGSIDRRPAMVVRPHGAADVIDAVAYARAAELPLSVRCGGHGIAGTSVCEGGVLIDLGALKGVHVEPARGTALVQGGALWGEYDREAELFGMATPGGRVTTTGVGGFTLGGGYGWLSPVHGLACDNLVAVDMVTADGRLIHVTEDSHPELMFGLRGAGANFGIVTSYELRVHRVEPLLLAGLIGIPNTDGAADVVRGYRALVEQADERLVTALATVRTPPLPGVPPEDVGSPMLGLVACWIGDPLEGEEAIRPLRQLVPGAMDMIQPMPYTAFQQILDGFAPRGWLNYHRGVHLSGLPDEVVDGYLEVGRAIGSPMTQGVMFRHGGAVSRVSDDDTAAGNRDAPYMAHPIACWATPEETDYEMQWVRRFSEAVGPAATGGTYLNFEPGTSLMDIRAGYGDRKLERLTALKDEWDPTNLFRSNHNIPPSDWQHPVVPAQSRG
jgi:FAD/FMN-containing dehydrogenase